MRPYCAIVDSQASDPTLRELWVRQVGERRDAVYHLVS